MAILFHPPGLTKYRLAQAIGLLCNGSAKSSQASVWPDFNDKISIKPFSSKRKQLLIQ